MPTYWYRYVDWAMAAPLDEYDMPRGRGGVHIHCERYPVIKETPKGVWLQLSGFRNFRSMEPEKRWVSRSSRKQFACPTKEEAMTSFLARKRRQAGIYRARAAYAEHALAVGREMQKREVQSIETDLEPTFKSFLVPDDDCDAVECV